MAKVTLKNGLLSMQGWGKFGKPNGVGEFWAGWSEFGDENEHAGYHKRQWNRHGKCRSLTKFFWPVVHITGPAIARKTAFRNGVTAWHALTDSERLVYNKKRYPFSQSGFNRYMSKYLKSH
jgi:hypothetical protein